jgi:hypothetical protein
MKKTLEAILFLLFLTSCTTNTNYSQTHITPSWNSGPSWTPQVIGFSKNNDTTYEVNIGICSYKDFYTSNFSLAQYIQLDLVDIWYFHCNGGIYIPIDYLDRAGPLFSISLATDELIDLPDFISLEPGIYYPFRGYASFPDSIGAQLSLINIKW